MKIRWILRILAGILFLTALELAWAGVWMYQGKQNLKQGNDAQALVFIKKAKKWDPLNPRLEALRAQAAWGEGNKSSDPKLLTTAAQSFRKLAEQQPHSGRFRVWAALAQLKAGDIPQEEWKRLKKELIEARRLEPGSAWAAYETGAVLLSRDEFLEDQERDWAVEQIRQSISFHEPEFSALYLPAPSPFLEPALSLLWNRYQDIQMLQWVTPEDLASYQKLLEFMDSNGLWALREEIHNTYLKLQTEMYDSECARGEEWLAKGKYKEAYFAFRKAFWMRSWAFNRAKAGILACEYQMGGLKEGPHWLFKKEVRETLTEILNDPGPIPANLLKALEPVIRKTPDLPLKKKTSGLSSASGAWTNGNRMNFPFSLKPGEGEINLLLRSKLLQKPNRAYTLIRFNEKEMRGIYLKGNWRMIKIPFKTSGGESWLVLELLHPLLPAGNKEPFLETALARVLYKET